MSHIKRKKKSSQSIKSFRNKTEKFFGLLSKQKITIYHEKLAEHVGLSRETVTRALQDLKNDGSIEIDDKGCHYTLIKNQNLVCDIYHILFL